MPGPTRVGAGGIHGGSERVPMGYMQTSPQAMNVLRDVVWNLADDGEWDSVSDVLGAMGIGPGDELYEALGKRSEQRTADPVEVKREKKEPKYKGAKKKGAMSAHGVQDAHWLEPDPKAKLRKRGKAMLAPSKKKMEQALQEADDEMDPRSHY